jgi:hypothetical protein
MPALTKGEYHGQCENLQKGQDKNPHFGQAVQKAGERVARLAL